MFILSLSCSAQSNIWSHSTIGIHTNELLHRLLCVKSIYFLVIDWNYNSNISKVIVNWVYEKKNKNGQLKTINFVLRTMTNMIISSVLLLLIDYDYFLIKSIETCLFPFMGNLSWIKIGSKIWSKTSIVRFGPLRQSAPII